MNAIHALSQLSYVPQVRAAEPHTGVSAGNRETYPKVYTKSSKKGWRKSQGPIFCSAFSLSEGARSALFGAGSIITSDVTLRRVTANR